MLCPSYFPQNDECSTRGPRPGNLPGLIGHHRLQLQLGETPAMSMECIAKCTRRMAQTQVFKLYPSTPLSRIPGTSRVRAWTWAVPLQAVGPKQSPTPHQHNQGQVFHQTCFLLQEIHQELCQNSPSTPPTYAKRTRIQVDA